MFLKSHVVEVWHPFALNHASAIEHILWTAPLEGFGFDLDQFYGGTVLDQNVCPEKQISVSNRSLIKDHRFPCQKLLGLPQSLLMIQSLDLVAIWEVKLGQLPDLKAPLGQSGEKGVVLLMVCVLRLSRVKQLCFALQCQDEAGFGQVAG